LRKGGNSWRAEYGASPFLSAANGAQAPVVLVVEDEFFIRLELATCLREAGYIVIESARGEEAIALCCRSAACFAAGWIVAE